MAKVNGMNGTGGDAADRLEGRELALQGGQSFELSQPEIGIDRHNVKDVLGASQFKLEEFAAGIAQSLQVPAGQIQFSEDVTLMPNGIKISRKFLMQKDRSR